jgi:hypothetical protein
MKCTDCIHLEKENCVLKACVYRHISEKELHDKGIHIEGALWEYDGKKYKSIGFEIATNSFICVEAIIKK